MDFFTADIFPLSNMGVTNNIKNVRASARAPALCKLAHWHGFLAHLAPLIIPFLALLIPGM